MRLNVYTTDFTGEFELVTSDQSEDGGEFLDGVRLVMASPDEGSPENAVTIWIPTDKYEQTAELFESVAESVRGLAKQRSRA